VRRFNESEGRGEVEASTWAQNDHNRTTNAGTACAAANSSRPPPIRVNVTVASRDIPFASLLSPRAAVTVSAATAARNGVGLGGEQANRMIWRNGFTMNGENTQEMMISGGRTDGRFALPSAQDGNKRSPNQKARTSRSSRVGRLSLWRRVCRLGWVQRR